MQPGRSLLGAGRLLILQKIHDRTFIRARTLIDFEMKFLAGRLFYFGVKFQAGHLLRPRQTITADFFKNDFFSFLNVLQFLFISESTFKGTLTFLFSSVHTLKVLFQKILKNLYLKLSLGNSQDINSGEDVY